MCEKEQLGARPAAQKGGPETVSGRTTFALSSGGWGREEAMQRPRGGRPKGLRLEEVTVPQKEVGQMGRAQ